MTDEEREFLGFGRGPGRPTLYKPDMPKRAYELALLGLTDEEIAKSLGVGYSTLTDWKVEYPEFGEAINDGKEPADAKVAAALFNRAMGMAIPDGVETKFDDAGNPYEVVKWKHLPPDPTSMIFYLKNRRKREWRDKVEAGLTDVDGNDIPIHIFKLPSNDRSVEKDSGDRTTEGIST